MSSAHPTGYPEEHNAFRSYPYIDQAMRRDWQPEHVQVDFRPHQQGRYASNNPRHQQRPQDSHQARRQSQNGHPALAPGAFADVELGDPKDFKSRFIPQREQRPHPWSSTWHWRRDLMIIAYMGLIASYIVYIYFRCRYTLKVASNRKDASGNAHYRVSVYSVLTLAVELLCMAAMALYAVNKTYYPRKTWMPPGPMSIKSAFCVKICVCCYKEATYTIAQTLEAAAITLHIAKRNGLIAPGSAIWLCDDTPAGKRKHPNDPEQAEKECIYTLRNQEFRHTGTMRSNRAQLLYNLRMMYPDTHFAHRLPTAPSRKAELNGLNKKSGNLNNVLREIWPQGSVVTDRDIVVVLDADQAAFPDFLTATLPCMDAGVDSDNVALVQSPQVFEGVHPIYDVFNHQNVEFWSTLMIAYNTTGFISCAGTNFAVRANALKALGPSPFPTHTVTEDFALGMRLRAHNPPFTGIYLPLQLVKGTAPDTIRAAFKQRSRWTKGPFQMMVSKESPFWYTPPAGSQNLRGQSLRDRICFLSPVFNTVVNSVSTPFYCFVPCFFIWSGRFPAALTLPAIISAVVTVGFTYFFKFFARPSVGVKTVVRRQDGSRDIKGDQVRRRKHSFLSYVLAEWNADVNIRNFWWMFAKVIINFFLRLCGLRRPSGFSATVGESGGFFEGFTDILPLFLLWLVLMASVVWAALQLYVGARFLGPLGICMAWALYQAVPPFAMMCYVLFRVRHAPVNKGCCWCYEHWGRAVFSIVYLGGFVFSMACLIVVAILAVKTFPRQSAFTQNVRTFTDRNGQQITYHYFYSVKTTWELLRSNMKAGKGWEWHW